MTDHVDPTEVETIVRARRHPFRHVGRADGADQRVYVLHSEECRAQFDDLRECPYSRALDNGIDPREWPDGPTWLGIGDGHLIPIDVRPAPTL